MTAPSYLKIKNGGRLAYHKTEGSSPGIVFLGGFRSDMTGVKAIAMEAFCQKRGQAFVRFDYEGHGASSTAFDDCTIGTWKEDALAVLLKLTAGPQVLIGSSMGGWLSLLLAMEKPRRVAGIIGIAAAPDFTERMIRERFTEKQKKELMSKGRIMVPSDFSGPYPITLKFIEESQRHLLLHKEIPVYCPVRLLHGLRDEDVPWEISFAINEKVVAQDVKTILIEGGDHRLSRPEDIEKLLGVTARMLEGLEEKKGKKAS